MAERGSTLQDVFLNTLRKNKTPVTMFLVKGVKLQGVITWFDNFSLLLRRDGQSQLVYKHAISTIMPGHGFDIRPVMQMPETPAGKSKSLQEVFLGVIQRDDEPVTVFLVNGVMLQGHVAAYDLFSVLLERDKAFQLVYKHAMSTVQPNGPINLMPEETAEDTD